MLRNWQQWRSHLRWLDLKNQLDENILKESSHILNRPLDTISKPKSFPTHGDRYARSRHHQAMTTVVWYFTAVKNAATRAGIEGNVRACFQTITTTECRRSLGMAV
jgi:hypothetical protein